jgi:hypothetical protein
MTTFGHATGKAHVHSVSGPAQSSPSSFAAGLTLVESVIATVVVGAMLVAALNTVGASRLSQFKTCQWTRGQNLATDLMVEIMRQAYEDPDGTPSFGCEAGEAGTGRSSFDDADDYHGWIGAPPASEDGTAIPGWSGWKRTVTVEWVDPMDPGLVMGSESGVKRITVSVAYNDMPMASVVGLRSASGW